MRQQELAVQQFGATAAAYLTSAVHAGGADLDDLTTRVRETGAANVLDLGCGAGHAAFAAARGGAARVTAYDPSTAMREVVAAEAAIRGHSQIITRAGSAESLPFEDAAFDLVVTRYSAHHWVDAGRAVREVDRVLRPGGTFIVIDVLSPENPLLDTALQTVELLRDPSHVRDYRESEWRALLASASFDAPDCRRWKLPMAFRAWVTRIGTSDARVAALEVVLDELASEVRAYFEVDASRSFALDAGWLATRRSSAPTS